MSKYPFYPNISSRSWEHPADKAALTALRAIPGLDDLIKVTIGKMTEDEHKQKQLKKMVLVTAQKHPKLYDVYLSVLHTFDVKTQWPLYLSPEPGVNAYAFGMHSPFITITIDAANLTESSARMILAHEVGHILAGHGLYRTMLKILLSVGWLSGLVPATIPIQLGVLLAMLEWQRCSEFTADRASALAMGNEKEVVKVFTLFQDPSNSLHELIEVLEKKIPSFMHPVLEGSLNGIRKLSQSHPDPQVRIDALKEWCSTSEFHSILAGDYIRKNETSLSLKGTATSAKEEILRIGERAQELGVGAQATVEEVWNRWNPWSEHE